MAKARTCTPRATLPLRSLERKSSAAPGEQVRVLGRRSPPSLLFQILSRHKRGSPPAHPGAYGNRDSGWPATAQTGEVALV